MSTRTSHHASATLGTSPKGTTCQNNQKEKPNTSWQSRFLQLLPAIRCHAQVRFRGLNAEVRADMVQEVIARALVDYCRLVEQDREHLASATPLARFAVAQVSCGRRVGGRLNIRDVSSPHCQRRHKLLIHSLTKANMTSDGWRDALVEDRRTGPAQIAAARIDFAEWLKTLPQRSQRLAKRLAAGESTSAAALRFGISPGRVSQLRRELCRAWHAFQGEALPATRR